MFNWINKLIKRWDNPVSVNSEKVLHYLLDATQKLDSEMAIPAFYRGLSIVAGGVSKLPIKVYSKEANNNRKIVTHAATPLLKRPNKYIAWDYFISLMVQHVMRHGNGYAMINRDSVGKPIELIPLDPKHIVIVLDKGLPHYVYMANNKPERIDYFDMLHFRGLGDDAWMGLSVIDAFSGSIEFANSLTTHGIQYFRNGARPGQVIILPPTMKDPVKIKELQDRLNTTYAGVSNASKIMMLENGTTVQAFPTNNDIAQFLGNRQFCLIDIANITGVPASKLGSTVNTSYSSLTAEDQSLLSHTIEPILVRIENELEAKLLSEAEKQAGKLYIEFNRDAFVNIDPVLKRQMIRDDVNNGLLSEQEGRALLNLPTDKDSSQRWRYPANIIIEGQEPTPAPSIAAPASVPAPTGTQPGEAEARALRAYERDTLSWLARKLERGTKKPAEVVELWRSKLPSIAQFAEDVLAEHAEEWEAVLPEQRSMITIKILQEYDTWKDATTQSQ